MQSVEAKYSGYPYSDSPHQDPNSLETSHQDLANPPHPSTIRIKPYTPQPVFPSALYRKPTQSSDYFTIFSLSLPFELARRVWLRICLAVFIITGLYGIILGGHIQRVGDGISTGIDAVIQDVGFRIEDVQITGYKNTRSDEVIAALRANEISLLNFDTNEARERVEDLPWVRQAHILRLFPSTLKVTIEERVPYAMWQHKGKHYWIDHDGVAITEIQAAKLPDRPLIVGKGAGVAAPQLFKDLKSFPILKDRMAVAFRVAERRWTLRLKNGLEIWLPAQNPKEALYRLEALQTEYNVLSGHIARLDMRLVDRITMKKANS